jgi:hypothetical protein
VTLDAISQAVLAALETIPSLLVYDGTVPDSHPRDEDGRAARYAVLYMGGGRAWSDRHGAAAPTQLRASFFITCAAGTPRGALSVVDDVRGALTGLLIDPDDPMTGRIQEPPGDPGPIRLDREEPADLRWFVPLPFYVPTTT